ncbi:hypothetical protein EKO04_001531 [Ascochyta lentis]|uniref:Uncharacterized protein n=1 Tax=Ascochyta lentis TaxID=205686 RepID=A0A8H7MM80_9PLEO|nr:hypothetical protein EKO04_001531 [Ascochyta lentis]
MRLYLREPRRSMRIEFAKYIEETCSDYDTAEEIRGNLMSDWTRSLIREFAIELWRQQGYEVEYQYVGGRPEDEGDEGDEGLTDEDSGALRDV